MTRILRQVALCGLSLCAFAQEDTLSGKPFFVQVGVNKIDSGADTFTVVGQVGVPVLKRGLSQVGVFAGVTQWKRGAYVASGVVEGDLLEKNAFWGGVYWGDQFWTGGVAAEYGKKQTYTVPRYTNDYYTSISKSQFGAGAFISLHWKNGFGAFVRAGSQSGVGAGLSLNF